MKTNAEDEKLMTLSQSQFNFGPIQIAKALLSHGANVNAGDNGCPTSLYQELEGEYYTFNSMFSVFD